MRICHITSMHECYDSRIYQRACVGLARLGFDVHLVAPRPEKEEEADDDVSFHWIKQRIGLKRRIFSSFEAVSLAIATNAEIYHFHDPDLLPFILRIKLKNKKAKIVYDIHENYSARFCQWGLPRFLGRIFRKYEIWMINKLDGYATTTETMKQLFYTTKSPGIVIRNTVDVKRLPEVKPHISTPLDIPTIYTSGIQSHSRLVLQTVQSMKYLINNLNFQMLFGGRFVPGLKEEIIQVARIEGTHEFLKIEGMLPWAQNFERTAKAFCGCVFYADDENNEVTLPNRVYEYMFCGIPIVVSDFPELRKIIEKTGCGIIVKSEKPEDIAIAFRYLLENPEEAKRMGDRGRKAIFDEYGYHKDLERIQSLYEQISKHAE